MRYFHGKRKNIFWPAAVLIFALLALANITVYFLGRSEIKPASISAVPKAEAGPLVIETDKNKYSLGEIVKIYYSNQALKAIAEASSTRLNVPSSRFLGRNYGVGLIERYFGGKWLAIEPVWRCSMDCFNPCAEEREIPREARKTFYWKQTMLVCSGKGADNEIVSVEPGRYRIVSAVWDKNLEDYKIIHSNEFEIK